MARQISAAGDEKWFPGNAPGKGEATSLIDGPATFKAMVEAIETAETRGHFIVLLGWSLDHGFPLDATGKTFLHLAEERASRGVAVRVLLFDNTDMWTLADERGKDTGKKERVNVNAFKALNHLRTSRGLDVHCNLDDNTNGRIPLGRALIERFVPRRAGIHSYGSHHHKILLVHGRAGLLGFCGGIDLDPNRSTDLHDVHLRLTGAPVRDLFQIAQQRWAHAEDDGRPAVPRELDVRLPPEGNETTPPRHLVQIFQTVGNPELKSRVPNTLWPAVRHAVREASRFIYLEDQYFMSLDLVRELVHAARRLAHITILLPGTTVTEPITWNARQRALRELVRLGGPGIEKKIGIYQHTLGAHECIHSKLLLFDDDYALVGSANANNRGYFLDSEAAAGIADIDPGNAAASRRGVWLQGEASFARRLRADLWSEHLGLPPAELLDGVGARIHWEKLPPQAKVTPYLAVNVKKCRNLGQKYHDALSAWQLRRDAAAKARVPFDEPKPVHPIERRDQAVWWAAPYDAWAAFPTAEEAFLDPKD
jgi:phosphatidylserine/phosphatidylglycerophosphate/cardiolipin synthase-like enzyme